MGKTKKAGIRETIKKAPDDAVYFPQEMRWESFSMQRSVGEREEAQRYANGKAVYIADVIFAMVR